jgi:hypothetical protein
MALMPGWALAGPATAIPLFIKDFNSDLNSVVDAVINWPTLLLGLGVKSSFIAFLLTGCPGPLLGAVRVVLWSPSFCTFRFSCRHRYPFLGWRGSQSGQYGGFSYCLCVGFELPTTSVRNHCEGHLFPP